MTTDWTVILIAVIESAVDHIIGNLTTWLSYHGSSLMPFNDQLQSMGFGKEFSVTTEWDTWGPCVACNRPQGERRRVGRCRIKRHKKQVQCSEGKDFSLLLHCPVIHPNFEGNVTWNVKIVIVLQFSSRIHLLVSYMPLWLVVYAL
jgi:hypothetical protein